MHSQRNVIIGIWLSEIRTFMSDSALVTVITASLLHSTHTSYVSLFSVTSHDKLLHPLHPTPLAIAPSHMPTCSTCILYDRKKKKLSLTHTYVCIIMIHRRKRNKKKLHVSLRIITNFNQYTWFCTLCKYHDQPPTQRNLKQKNKKIQAVIVHVHACVHTT